MHGGSYRVHVPLTRAALWILGLGLFERGFAHETAGRGEQHSPRAPETFGALTPPGHFQGVTDQVRMPATPGRYRTVLVPRGSGRPEWPGVRPAPPAPASRRSRRTGTSAAGGSAR